MQRIRDHARALEFLGEIDGEHDLGELALAVGGNAAVALGQLTSEKSIACWPADETLTMRAGAAALSSGRSS